LKEQRKTVIVQFKYFNQHKKNLKYYKSTGIYAKIVK